MVIKPIGTKSKTALENVGVSFTDPRTMLQELQHLLDAQFPDEAGLGEFHDAEVPAHVHV